jgi:hypothetical protein
MAVEKMADGHAVRVGDFDSGQGIRIHIDGKDVTDQLSDLFPPREDGHGMRMPHGKHKIANEIKIRIIKGDITIND